MRKAAGILFLLYVGMAIIFVIAYGVATTQFNLPNGPPIIALLSVLAACAAVMHVTRNS